MSLPVERIEFDPPPDPHLDLSAWPFTLPVVEALRADDLELGPLTVLVGENGSGKSTLVEAIAMAFGMSPEGGSTGARHRTRPSESELYRALRLHRGIGAARWGFFLRAETMHGFYTYLEEGEEGSPRQGQSRFHEMSHGESFVEVLTSRFQDSGLYVLDEPESALSFTNCLGLVALLHRIVATRNVQVIVATHSPIVAAVPDATVLELGEWGIRPSTWADLDVVQDWQAFLDQPALFLRHLLKD